jgi:toxin ParE2
MVEAADYYDAEAYGLGDRFLDDVQHTLNLISGRPEIGTKVSGSLRRVLCRRFPFSVIYAIEPDT